MTVLFCQEYYCFEGDLEFHSLSLKLQQQENIWKTNEITCMIVAIA